MKALFFVLIFCALTSACSSQPASTRREAQEPTITPIITIKEIANQTQEDLEHILGLTSSFQPLNREELTVCKNCQKYIYKNGLVRIVYINDMADWITVNPPDSTPVRDALPLLGLPATPPVITTDSLSRWTSVQGLREINVYTKPDGTIDYILVKAFTL
ncbi:putative periplasmic lipoprotein [Telluribacter humicola]|uniref:hypothetical protein n=1 Tax=Telluribacter humicola TaxID=1720261 RepID=UPI001A96AF85|nr:hypothetical protein [Telluribacter humicola]